MIDISKGRYWDLPWSLVDGCTPCSPGCEHCWSAGIAHRFYREGEPGHCTGILTDNKGRFNGDIITRPDRLSIPLKRRKPTVYAVWNDLYHEAVPFDFILAALAHAVGRYDLHKYLILTKRPQRMVDFFLWMDTEAPYRVELGRECWWWGLTVCNQQEANEKIPVFLQVPGKKFLSIEPMLGAMDFGSVISCNTGFWGSISAVILGGETGPGARMVHPDWVRSVRDQCAAAGAAFFFKSWGAWKPCDRDHEECEGHKSTAMRLTGELVTDESPIWKDKTLGGTDQGFWRAGSKSGRLLDGRTHDDLPWRVA